MARVGQLFFQDKMVSGDHEGSHNSPGAQLKQSHVCFSLTLLRGATGALDAYVPFFTND